MNTLEPNELLKETRRWEHRFRDSALPRSVVRELFAVIVLLRWADLQEAEEQAMAEFGSTVQAIEQARLSDAWQPAAPGCISEQDCALCDFKWDCPTPNGGKGVKLQYP